jgi:hypothetical protein
MREESPVLSTVYQLTMWMALPVPPGTEGDPGTSVPLPPYPPTVVVNPTGIDAPGKDTIQDLLDWLGQYSLWACVAAMVAGGGLFAWARRTGGHSMAVTGTALAGGGAVGTILVGLAPEIVNTLYRHA